MALFLRFTAIPSQVGPGVRIRLAPAESLQTLGPSRKLMRIEVERGLPHLDKGVGPRVRISFAPPASRVRTSSSWLISAAKPPLIWSSLIFAEIRCRASGGPGATATIAAACRPGSGCCPRGAQDFEVAQEVVAVPLDLYAERHHADIHSTARRLPSS